MTANAQVPRSPIQRPPARLTAPPQMSLEERYELLEKLGTGSFATVYRARDNELGREVAIKAVHPQYLDDPEQLDRYWQEATLLASLQHPNVVTIYDVHREKGWLILELMQGSLGERMANKQMDLRALRATLAHALRALKYLHGRGIIHGDVKPSNLMIDHRRRVKVGDFGLARRASNEEGSLLKGTTKYMAPEVVSEEFGQVGPASDLYSLGFTAYSLMCGPNFETLFPGLSAFGRNQQIAWMMWHAAPDRKLPPIGRILADVPEDLARVIEKLCEKDQSKRYASADEALADLGTDSSVVMETTAKPEAGTDGEAETEPEDKTRTYIAAGAFAFSLLLCLFMLWPSSDGKQTPTGAPTTVGFVRSIDVQQNVIEWTDVVEGVPDDLPLVKKPKLWFTNTQEYIRLDEVQPGDRVQWEPVEEGRIEKVIVSRPLDSAGRVVTVDLYKKTVLVAIEEEATEDEVLLAVPPRAKLILNGERVELGDFRPEDKVRVLHLDPVTETGPRVLEKMEATRVDEKVGHFLNFEPANREMQVRLGSGPRSEIARFKVPGDVSVVQKATDGGEGFPLELSDLQSQDRIRFTFDAAVRTIEVYRGDGKLTGGMITKADVGGQQITVSHPDGSTSVFRVPGTADITVGHRTADLASLRETDRVDVLYVNNGGADSDPRRAITIDADRGERYDRFAFLIGVENYTANSVPPLLYANDNVMELQETLRGRYAFANNQVEIMLGPTRAELKRELDLFFNRVTKVEELIVFLCCHAFEASDGRVYVACSDFDPSKMAETGMPLQEIVSRFDRLPAERAVLLLDTSHRTGRKSAPPQPSAASMVESLDRPPLKMHILTPGTKSQKDMPAPKSGLSLFGKALAEGYSGRADRDQDLTITPQELWSFIGFELSKYPLPDGDVLQPTLLPSR